MTAMRPCGLATLSVFQFQKNYIPSWAGVKYQRLCGQFKRCLKNESRWLENYRIETNLIYSVAWSVWWWINKLLSRHWWLHGNSSILGNRNWSVFLGVNNSALHRINFFKHQHLCITSFNRIVESVLVKEGISVSGSKGWSTTHGLLGILASLLFAAGHSDSSFSLLTGHRDPRLLKHYQNYQLN